MGADILKPSQNIMFGIFKVFKGKGVNNINNMCICVYTYIYIHT